VGKTVDPHSRVIISKRGSKKGRGEESSRVFWVKRTLLLSLFAGGGAHDSLESRLAEIVEHDLDERRIHRAGMDRVAANVILGIARGNRSGEQCYRALRRPICFIRIFMADKAAYRRHIKDSPAAGGSHNRKSVLDAEKRPLEINGEHGVEGLRRHLLNILPDIDAGIVDQNIQTAFPGPIRNIAPGF
jgi:hypothetical protein